MLVYGQGCYETAFSGADGMAPSATESLLHLWHLSLPKSSSACRYSLLEKLIKATVPQQCNGVLDRKAGSAEKHPVLDSGRVCFGS